MKLKKKNCIMRSIMVYNFQNIFGLSDQGEKVCWSMQHAWRRREFHVGFDEKTKS
jgi:hypothetical protein